MRKEETWDTINETLVHRNELIHPVPGVEGKIDGIFSKSAAGGTIHNILKCDSTFRVDS